MYCLFYNYILVNSFISCLSAVAEIKKINCCTLPYTVIFASHSYIIVTLICAAYQRPWRFRQRRLNWVYSPPKLTCQCEIGIRIPIVNRISDSLVSIPDSKAQDSRSHKEIFPGLWIPPSSETQGQSDEGRKGARKVFKHGLKSPWVPTLTRQVGRSVAWRY